MWPGQSVQRLVLCHADQTVLQVIVLGLLLDNSVVDNDQGLILLNDLLLKMLGVALGICSLDFLLVTKIPGGQEIDIDLTKNTQGPYFVISQLVCRLVLKVCRSFDSRFSSSVSNSLEMLVKCTIFSQIFCFKVDIS